LGIAAVMVVGALALFFGQHAVRTVEAGLAAMLLGVTQVDAPRALGTNVLVPLRGARIALDITASCSAALMASPFFLLAGGLLLSRRTSLGSAVKTLGVMALWLFAMNQLRILLVVLSMRMWGFQRGYELSHIAFGSVISTLAVLGGVLLFVRAIAHGQPVSELRA